MLKKIAFIPEKIYRVSYKERTILSGTNYDLNKKKIKSKGCYFELKHNGNLPADYLDNNPITDVVLLTNNTVQINGEYDTYVDNDFISDVAFNSLASKSGKLKGSYIFVAVTNKLRLTRVDGPLYKQILLSQNRRSASKIKKKDFKIGGVYSTPSGISAIYLGAINTKSPVYGGKKYDTYPANNRMLFLSCDKYNPYINVEDINPYHLEVKKTHSFIEMVDSVKLPSNTISIIRDKMVSAFKQDIVESTTKERGEYYLQYKFFKYCPLVNMHEPGSAEPKKFDINKYLVYA